MWKKLILGLLGLIVVLVLVGFLLPGKMEVSRSLRVNAPPEYSFEEVNMLPNWQKWSYWNTLDTSMVVTYGDKTSGQGGSYSWESEDMGPGKLIITESIPYQTIKADLDFMEQGTAKAWYNFEPSGDSTNITMGFSTEFGANPLMRWIGFTIMESEMNKAFDHNLNRLKEIAEAKPKFSVKITEETVSPVSYIGVAATMNPQDVKAVVTQMGKMYSSLTDVTTKSKVQINGHSFAIFPRFTDTSMDVICAVPVAPDSKLPAKYKVQELAGGKAVKAIHIGAYETLESTHNEINKYVAFKNLEVSGAPWEVYVTDATTQPDQSQWVTEVYYPVK
jgi:effector-binding domain-containing protein